MGHLSTKQELIAILRRFDMDGDAKINMAEFTLGMKSSLKIFASKTKRPNSSAVTSFAQKLGAPNTAVSGATNKTFPIRRSSVTPR